MTRRPWRPSTAASVFLFLTVLTNLPYLRAFYLPPAGKAFVGVFYSIPDVYNYFGYMQQAEDGVFLFRNKLTLDEHPGGLVNLEWWAVGRLAALAGVPIPVAFRGLGLLVSLALVLGIDRWLERAGLPASHRLGALFLVFLGAGFGGLLFLAFGPPAWRFLDLTTGLFPVISVLVNPHFVTGTALVVWAVLCLIRGGTGGTLVGILLTNVLGLCRPYDVVLVVGTTTLTVLLTRPLSEAPRRLLPFLGILPAVFVNYWALYANSAFRMLSAFKYSVPPLPSLLLALGPAIALAALGLRAARPGEGSERTHRVALLAWSAFALLAVFVISKPVPYMFQAAVNIGVPLFAVAALGFAARPARHLLLAALLASSTGLVALKLLLEDNPSWFVPKGRLQVAQALRPLCQPGDVAMAPEEIGMYLNALSSCRPFLTHGIAPDTEKRRKELRFFYLRAGPDERRALLDRRCVTHAVLPLKDGFDLGPDFRLEVLIGSPPGGFAIYARGRPASCRARDL